MVSAIHLPSYLHAATSKLPLAGVIEWYFSLLELDAAGVLVLTPSRLCIT